ncbi:MAG: pentapeptide repeat-containing protein [Streptosporangiales bacterium]|nr:pentapeptide repeat-containing protein [Streptosporangiales bacterium]
MADFSDQDLRGSRFERVDLSGSRFRGVEMHHVVMRGVELAHAEISGELLDVTIDAGPLIEAELDRRYPDRVKMRPDDPAGFREAWDVVERLWTAPSRGRGGSIPRSCTSPSTASGRSSRRCGTWPSRRTPGSGAASSATRRRGIRSTSRGTRCPTRPVCPATVTCARPWTRCSRCAATGWGPYARTPALRRARPRRARGPRRFHRRGSVRAVAFPAGPTQGGTPATDLRAAPGDPAYRRPARRGRRLG